MSRPAASRPAHSAQRHQGLQRAAARGHGGRRRRGAARRSREAAREAASLLARSTPSSTSRRASRAAPRPRTPGRAQHRRRSAADVRPLEATRRGPARGRPHPGRRRQRQQPRPAVAPPVARGPRGDAAPSPAGARSSSSRSRKFDLVLLDLMMPDMNGFEVLERLKADERLHDIPVIMISGLQRDRQRDPLHRGGRRGLSAQAVQPGPAARPHQRLPRAQALARARAPLSGADRAREGAFGGAAAQHPARADRRPG